MSMNMRFDVSFIDLFITIQCMVLRKSLSTFNVSLFIYIYMHAFANEFRTSNFFMQIPNIRLHI